MAGVPADQQTWQTSLQVVASYPSSRQSAATTGSRRVVEGDPVDSLRSHPPEPLINRLPYTPPPISSWGSLGRQGKWERA